MVCSERSIRDLVPTPTSSSQNSRTTPNLLHLSDDLLIFFLSSWLDVRSLGLLDIAVANRNNRLFWQKCLSATNASVFDDWRYNHSSISWLIQRRISATKIQINYRNGMKVSDSTFDGIHIPLLRSIYLSNCTDMTDRGVLSIVKSAANRSHSMQKCNRPSSCSIISALPKIAIYQPHSMSLDN